MLVEHELVSLDLPGFDGALDGGAQHQWLVVHVGDVDDAGHLQFMRVVDRNSYFVGHVDEPDVGEGCALVFVCEVNVGIASVVPVNIRVLQHEVLSQLVQLPIFCVVLEYGDHAVLTQGEVLEPVKFEGAQFADALAWDLVHF